MLTEREKMYVYALWQKRVAAGKYLKDIPPERLTVQELCDLIPSAFYAKESLTSIPERKYFSLYGAGLHSEILRQLIQKHRKNSSI